MKKHETKMVCAFLDKVIEGVWPTQAAEAKALKAKVCPKARAAKPMKRARLQAKAAGKQERRERVAALRAEAFEGTAGECALCCQRAADLHHVLSGPERRRRESIETVAPVCREHHRALHRNDGAALRLLAAWLRSRRYAAALFAVERRIAKVTEARAAQAERGMTP